jgi:hypothetical protein
VASPSSTSVALEPPMAAATNASAACASTATGTGTNGSSGALSAMALACRARCHDHDCGRTGVGRAFHGSTDATVRKQRRVTRERGHE